MKTVGSLFVIAAVCFALVVSVSYCVPFILIPGFLDTCGESMKMLIERLEAMANTNGFCIDIEGSARKTVLTPLIKQTEIVCQKVKKMNQLKNGYNIVGLSQGALVARGVIEFCDGGPPVKNFISLGGPHAGIRTLPSVVPGFLKSLCKSNIYKKCVQNHLAISGYMKIPTRMKEYYENSKFLPKLNNEIASERNSTYKKRFSSLENLVLIMFEEDAMLTPKESSWFGYYPDGASSPVLAPKQTKLYTEDWIGLRTLDEQGKVRFVKTPTGHLVIGATLRREHITPFLKD